jgi:oxygen-independent coproporphyrinogen-3 oxidase
VLALDPPHVSAYALTVEPATPFGRRVAEGAPGPDEDDQATKYEVADARLGAAGLGWYEISNWARPGHECRHNLLYWSRGAYLGIGCAAHGHTTFAEWGFPGSGFPGSGFPGSGSPGSGDGGRGSRRWWNVRTPERYVERVRAGRSPETGGEDLDPAAAAEEAFGLALRTRAGAPLAAVQREEAAALSGAGLIDAGAATAGRALLTRRGRLLASEVTARLLAAVPPGTATPPSGAAGPPEGAGTPGWHSVHSSAKGSTPIGAGLRNPSGGLFLAAAGADTPGASRKPTHRTS